MTRSRYTTTLLAALPLLLSACDSGLAGPERPGVFDPAVTHYALAGEGSGVILRTDGGLFTPGGTLDLVLENATGEALGYNLCFHELELREGTEWLRLEQSRICTLEIRVVETGRSAAQAVTLPWDVTPGEYRVIAAVHFMGRDEGRMVVSEGFWVGG